MLKLILVCILALGIVTLAVNAILIFDLMDRRKVKSILIWIAKAAIIISLTSLILTGIVYLF